VADHLTAQQQRPESRGKNVAMRLWSQHHEAMTTNATDLLEEVLAIIIEAGFAPTDDLFDFDLLAKSRETVAYFAARGFDAFRVEADGALTFAAWSEDGLRLMETTPSGVINAEARFDASERGLAWFAGAVS